MAKPPVTTRCSLVLVAPCLLLVLSLPATGQTPGIADDGPPPEPATLTPEAGDGPVIPPVPPGCADAIVDDDGTVETGYSWVPSAVEGIYTQQYQNDEVPTGVLTSVCVCWLRTRMDDSVDFEVVVYGHNPAEESPTKDPIAVVPARLEDVPLGIPGATFTEVPLGEVELPPEDPFYVGVRWDPSADQFFFVCVDKTDRPEPPTRVFFRDDRFPSQWGVSDMTNDITFQNHQAMFIRPVPLAGPATQLVEVPLSGIVSGALLVALLLVGALILRRS